MARLSPLFLLIVSFALILAGAWGMLYTNLNEMQATLEAESRQEASDLAESYAKQTDLFLQAVDQALLRLRHVASEGGVNNDYNAFALEAREIMRSTGLGLVARAAVVGADGMTRINLRREERIKPEVSVNDRDYFNAFRSDDSDRLFISEPIVGRVTRQVIVVFSRPLVIEDHFSGVVFLAIEPEVLARHLGTIKPDAVVTLVSRRGNIIARSKMHAELVGQPYNLPPERRQFTRSSTFDGQTRHYAVAAVGDTGLTISAGKSANATATAYQDYAGKAIALTSAFSVLILLTGLLAAWSLRYRQRAEAQRRVTEQRYRDTVEALAEAVLVVSRDGRVLSANSAARQLLNAPEGQTLAALIDALGAVMVNEDGSPAPLADPVATLCLQQGRELDDLWMTYDIAGDPRWLLVRARPYGSGPDCQLGGTVVTLTDQTDQHERLMAMALSHTLVESAADAVMVTDATGIITDVNPAFALLTGYAPEEVIGHRASVLNSGRHERNFFTEMWARLQDEGRWSGNLWNRRKDGSLYCVWHSISAVRTGNHGQVRRYVAVSRDITAQQAREQALWRQANHDTLTGLPNRLLFANRLEQALTQARRHGHPLAIGYLDLDRFKPVNDTWGHAIGDAVLCQVAERIQAMLRNEDTFARIGGDEFAFLLPRLEQAGDAEQVAQKMIACIARRFAVDDIEVSIGASIGLALWQPGNAADNETPAALASTLTAAADAALYTAKHEGRDTYRLAPTG